MRLRKRKDASPPKNTGKAFELAVTEFVKALDPKAEVTHNFKGRDRDTGERQQMDVWVKATVMGFFPVTILISCKDYGRVLHAGDIRTFCAEVHDSSASMGIIFSSRGFNKIALKKAKTNGICCCQLFQNEPARLPDKIGVLFRCYVAAPTVNFPVLKTSAASGLIGMEWEQILLRRYDGQEATILDAVCSCFREGQRASRDACTARLTGTTAAQQIFPLGWKVEQSIILSDTGTPAQLIIEGGWRRYIGKPKAQLINGSYCFTNDTFRGSQTTPFIDMKGPTPGPGWQETTDDVIISPPHILAILLKDDVAKPIMEAAKGKRLVL